MKQDLRQKFIQFIKDEKLFTSSNRLLLAVSGGVDSVVLAKLCEQAGFTYSIAHCNFQLRGSESSRDEAFVSGLAQQYNRRFYVKHFETARYAAENNCSIQVAARELRYRWFEEILSAPEWQGAFLVTAHHADDAIETLLMNFFKGTGIAGLRSILPKQNNIVRPLLSATKEEIISFAGEAGLASVEDSSNLSDKYTRNYFRHQVIPLIKQVYPAAIDNLYDNRQRFGEIETLYVQAIDAHKKNLLVAKGEEVHIPVLKLQQASPLQSILFEILKPYGFSPHQIGDVRKLLYAESGKYISSHSHRVIRHRKWLISSPNKLENSQTIVIDRPAGTLFFAKFSLSWETLPLNKAAISQDAVTGCLDASRISFPLVLRPVRTGDYFYPLGMPKKKKVGRFLSDKKLSVTEKENTWVLETDSKIVWIVGHRIDDRFKISGNTKEILKFVVG